MAKTARDIMTARVVTTTASATVAEAAKLLTDNGISGMPVVGEGEVVGLLSKVIGIVSQADIITASKDAPVESVMSREVVSVGPDTPISEVIKSLAGN